MKLWQVHALTLTMILNQGCLTLTLVHGRKFSSSSVLVIRTREEGVNEVHRTVMPCDVTVAIKQLPLGDKTHRVCNCWL